GYAIKKSIKELPLPLDILVDVGKTLIVANTAEPALTEWLTHDGAKKLDDDIAKRISERAEKEHWSYEQTLKATMTMRSRAAVVIALSNAGLLKGIDFDHLEETLWRPDEKYKNVYIKGFDGQNLYELLGALELKLKPEGETP